MLPRTHAPTHPLPRTHLRSYAHTLSRTLAPTHARSHAHPYAPTRSHTLPHTSQGHVKLADFGLAKEGIEDAISGANSLCGTPEYLAPEILDKQGHGLASDWWNMGMVLYEMLTGLPPWYVSASVVVATGGGTSTQLT